MEAKRHFPALDALRGVAAIGVMTFHDGYGWSRSGYLAVDMFFLLSGFVIALSYEQRLRERMTFAEFMGRRLIRLYPMILLGCIGGLIAYIVNSHYNANYIGEAEVAPLFLSSMALVPQIHSSPLGIETFPLNTALWSLFFELFANITYALGLFRWRSSVLAILVLLSLGAVVAAGSLGGNQAPNFWAGFPRVGFGFFGGVLLYRLYAAYPMAKWRLGALPLLVMLVLLLSIPIRLPMITLVPIFAVFAVIILAGATAEVTARMAAIGKLLGEISYPLYALHLPLFTLTVVCCGQALHGFDKRDPLFVALSSIAILVVSYAVLKGFDEPVRKRLTRDLIERPSARRARPLSLAE